jgi:hypothetical protein
MGKQGRSWQALPWSFDLYQSCEAASAVCINPSGDGERHVALRDTSAGVGHHDRNSGSFGGAGDGQQAAAAGTGFA